MKLSLAEEKPESFLPPELSASVPLVVSIGARRRLEKICGVPLPVYKAASEIWRPFRSPNLAHFYGPILQRAILLFKSWRCFQRLFFMCSMSP